MKNILVIEDNALVRDLIGSCLAKLHVSVRSVTSAEEGLEAIRGVTRPDLVLTDIVLPKRSGAELVRHLRAHPSTKNMPVVAVTVLADESSALQLKSLGFNDVIPKPIDPARFAAQVAQWLK
jgi:CheY-like chemotaxis protein